MRRSRAASNALPRLGELELSLLDLLWATPDQDAKCLRAGLPPAHSPSLSTVQSTLERLYRKGLLVRVKDGHAYRYRCALRRGELMGRLLGGVIRQLHKGGLEPLLTSFVDVAERLDGGTLDRLEALVRERQAKRLAEGDDEC